MKNFKNILASIALLSIGAMNAKQMGKKATPTPAPEIPSRTPKSTSSKQPSFAKASSYAEATKDRSAHKQPTKAKTLEQLYYDVKNAKNAWDNKTQLLNQTFVDNLVKDAIAVGITQDQLKFLLESARDRHAQFIGPKADIDILNHLEEQRHKALLDFILDKK